MGFLTQRNSVSLGIGGVPSLASGSGGGASLSLNFISGANSLDPRITFSRTSQATVTGINGLIQYAPSNLLTYSQAFDNAAWTKTNAFIQSNLLTNSQNFTSAWTQSVLTGVTANSVVAPDGTYTGSLIGAATGANAYLSQGPLTPISGQSYTLSFYARGVVGGETIKLLMDGGFGGVSSAVITLTTSWQRYTLTQTATSTTNGFVYALSGSSYGCSGQAYYLWGAQLVQGSVPGDYRATTSAALPVLYTAPDGTLTAEKLCEDATASALHQTNQSPAIVSGSVYTFSAYVKAAERTWAVLQLHSAIFAYVNLSTGAVGNTSGSPTVSVTSVGNGWYRVSVTAAVVAANAGNVIYTAPSNGTVSYTGDGSSGIYVYGAQLEQVTSVQPTPQAYAATTSAAYYGPRFDYDPTNVVSQNLLTYSQQVGGTNWLVTGGSLTTNAASAPDGTQTASTFFANAQYQNVNQSYTGFLKNTTYTFSGYMRVASGTSSAFVLQVYDGSVYFNTSITPTGTWQRFSLTFTTSAAATQLLVQFQENATSNYPTYQIWGAQLNVGSSALPYYATTSAPYTQVGIKGLLIEEGRTNLALYSEQFDNAAWTLIGSTVTANTVVAPDGTSNADSLVEDASTGNHWAFQTPVGTTAAAHTLTCYIKAGTRTWAGLRLTVTGTTIVYAWFNLSTGVVGTVQAGLTASIASVGNGWYRCSVTGTLTAGTPMVVFAANADNSNSYTGVNGNTAIYLWGAQLEAGAFATSYIPTTSASVARAADNASMTGTNFSSWFNASAGTFAVQYVTPQTSTVPVALGLQAGATGFNIGIGTSESWWNGSTNVTTANGVANGSTRKAGFAYTASTRAIVLNAGTVATDANVPWVTVPTSVYLGSLNGTTLQFTNGWIKALTFYPRAFSNTELQSVTS